MFSQLKASGGMSTVGLEIVVSILFGLLGGRWVDERFGVAPWGMIVGLCLGVATAARFIYRAGQRAERAMETDGFKASRTGRAARFALDEKERHG